MQTTKNYEVNYCKMCRNGYRIRMFSHISTLPTLLMNYQWSREQKRNRFRVSTAFTLTFRRTEIVTSAWGRKFQGLLGEGRTGTFVPKAENFGDIITADHKVLSEESQSRNNDRYAVVVQDLATQWLQSFPCKTKTSQETQKNLMKFLEPTKTSYSQSRMEQSKFLEDIRFWEHTGQPRQRRWTWRSSRRIRRVFFSLTTRVIVVWWWSQERFLVYFRELHLPSTRGTQSQTNCTCREKNHFLFHCNISTWPTEVIVGCNAGEVSTITGMLMEIESCQIRGLFSQDSPYWLKNQRMDTHGPERDWRKNKTTWRPDYLWPEMWKDMSDASERKEKQKWAIEKPKLVMPENCLVFTSLIQMMKNWRISWRMRAERCQPHWLARLNVRSTGRPVALKRKPRQNTLALLRRRIYEEAHGRISSQVSWRSYCRKRHEFIKSLQSGAQINSFRCLKH